MLPTGAVPVTTVTTTLAHGPGGLVVHTDRRRYPTGTLPELPELVPETGNPGNRAGLERVEVTLPAELLARG